MIATSEQFDRQRAVRSLSERAIHGLMLEELGVVPGPMVKHVADIIAEAQEMDAAMDDIHGVGMSECDANGGA